MIGQLGYQNLAGTTADIQASIDGGVLRVSAPLGVQPGTAARLTFDVTFKEFTVPGYVDVKVVSSTRAKAQAVDDGPVYLKRSDSATVDVLANDFNPFPDVPLTVIAAEVDQLDVGSTASASFTSTGVSVRTGAAFTGTLSVIYRIQDATKDPARETQGRVTVIVRDRPEQPNAPTVTAGDGWADVRWQAPAPNNSPITGYEVSYNGQVATYGAGAAGITQNIGGLTNGTAYTFTVRAINDIGASEWSSGTTKTPYGTPTAPRNVTLTSSGDAPADLTASWAAPATTGGGSITYQWRIVNAQGWQNTTGTSGRVNNVGAGTYTLEVRVVNDGSNQTGPTASDAVGVSNPPPPPPRAYICKGGPQGGGNAVQVRYENFTGGGHRMYTSIDGDSSAFYKETFNIGGDGKQTLQNWLGVRFDAGIWVVIEGPTNITKTNTISGAAWNNLSPGQCSG